jgi:putative Mn2+ efflux pump MntP
MEAVGNKGIVNPGGFLTPRRLKLRNDTLKKFAVLMGLVILALIIDGTMSYDIFDSRPETIKVWLVLALIVIIGLVIVIADSSKTNNKKDNSE